MSEQASAALRFTLNLPLKLAGRIATHAIQILIAIFIVVLHPQVKWLAGLIARSFIVQDYIRPGLRGFSVHIYEPYFAFLARLPPYWATFSIALPLAILEPAKFIATILIAERPKTGIMLWFALQGLSLVLIDRTWAAVRPQSRKLWLVSRLHAWLWLNAAYGKYWIKTSSVYRGALRLRNQARRTAFPIWSALIARKRRRKI